MNSLRLILVGLMAAGLSSCAHEPRRDIGSGSRSDYRIVVASDACETDLKAARQLQRCLARATGTSMRIVTDRDPPQECEVLVGRSSRLGMAGLTVDRAALGPDGFLWRTAGKRLAIIGGTGKGTLYGVCAFLEEHVGVRRYTPDVEIVPRKPGFVLPELNEIRRPAFPMRWLHMPAGESDAWCDWHGIHSRNHRQEAWGMFVHTFGRLVKASEHFEQHPEYFSMLKGRRSPDYQLCLSNQDVFRLVVAGLRKRMTARPDAQLWSVSQNDCFGPCECEPCAALARQYGGEAGPLLHFVNRVAAEFPDKIISTLAYQYTRRAPRGIKPAPNVNICLCSIECDRAEPLSPGERNTAFVRDLREWSALTDNLMVWDYVVQFTNYVSPFPNFHVLQPNIRLFRDHGVKLMFQQGSGGSKSDLFELKQYLIAKLLWNPDADVDALTRDFLTGYYGAASSHLARYMDLTHDGLLASGDVLQIYGNPVSEGKTWLTPDRLGEADRILAEAEQAVAGDAQLEARVRATRLSVTYATMEQGKIHGAGPHGFFERTPGGGFQIRTNWPARLERFVAACQKAGFRALHERSYTPQSYGEDMRRYFAEGMLTHLAARRPVDLRLPYSPKYEPGGAAALTDQQKGTTNYRYHWLGWEGTDMVATVDLQQQTTITRVRADFLQDIAAWVWLPLEMQVSASRDGKTFEPLAVLEPRSPATRKEAFIESLTADFPPCPARYIRIEARSCKRCPSWHHGAGGPSWVFCDEIIVR